MTKRHFLATGFFVFQCSLLVVAEITVDSRYATLGDAIALVYLWWSVLLVRAIDADFSRFPSAVLVFALMSLVMYQVLFVLVMRRRLLKRC